MRSSQPRSASIESLVRCRSPEYRAASSSTWELASAIVAKLRTNGNCASLPGSAAWACAHNPSASTRRAEARRSGAGYVLAASTALPRMTLTVVEEDKVGARHPDQVGNVREGTIDIEFDLVVSHNPGGWPVAMECVEPDCDTVRAKSGVVDRGRLAHPEGCDEPCGIRLNLGAKRVNARRFEPQS